MNYYPEKIRAPIKLHGGKHYLCRRIWDHRPTMATSFVDCFGGSGVMTLNAPRYMGRRQYNDLDPEKVNLMECLRDATTLENIEGYLKGVVYGERDFIYAKETLHYDTCPYDDIKAAMYVVRSRMSRGGLGRDFAWSSRIRGDDFGDVNAWKTFVESLPLIHTRLRGVEITNLDACGLVSQWAKDTWFYCDPPYDPFARATVGEYGEFDFDAKKQTLFLEAVTQSKNMIAISGYESPEYMNYLGRWRQVRFDVPNHSGQGREKNRRTEVLFMNY